MIPRFFELGDDAFEDLCREVLQEEPYVEAVERYGDKGQRQLGIDLLIVRNDRSLAVGQCKSHQHCDEKLIRSACEEFLRNADHWRAEGVTTFVLLLAADTRRFQLHDERLRQRELLRQQGFSFTVWSGAVLKAKLRKHRQIVRHFLAYLEDYICGPPSTNEVQLSVQRDTIVALARQLGEAAEDEHSDVRRLWQEGHAEKALVRLRKAKAEPTAWAVLPAETRAKFLRLEARLLLTAGELESAKRLAAEAGALATVGGERLTAMIAQAEGRLDDAIAVLDDDPDPDSQALKAAVLIQSGRLDEAVLTLERLPDNADAHRLRALIHLIQGEVLQAKAEAEKALALAPSWYWMRRTAATLRYLAGLSPVALPKRFPDWPEPVGPVLMRQDDESIAARRSAALEFERLAGVDFEHSADELSCLNAWRIACLVDVPDTYEQAVDLARRVLQTQPADYRALSWVLGRDLDVPVEESVTEIERLVADGKASVEATVTLVAAHARFGRLKTAQVVLNSARDFFWEQAAESLWLFWQRQVEALEASAGDSSAPHEERVARALARLRIADHEREREISWQQYFVLAQLGQWDQIAPVAGALVSELQTPDAVRLASYALYNTRDFAGCLDVLDRAPSFYAKGEVPRDLRRLRILVQHALGALPSAIGTAQEAFNESPTAESLMQLVRLYFQVGDLKAIAVVARHHESVPGLSALGCLQLAFYLKFEDPGLALTLWKRAVSIGIDDDHVAFAFGIASSLGVGADTKPLVDRLVAMGAVGEGGIQGFRLSELPGWLASRREHLNEVYRKLTAGDVTNHLALPILGVNLARAFHRFALISSSRSDGRTTGPIFQRSGTRVAGALPGEITSAWRLNADTTAVLTAAHFSLLPLLEKEFGTIRLPQHLVHALNAMQDDLRFHQPDRIAAVRRVLAAIADGRVQRVQPEPAGEREPADGDIADDVLQLLKRAARAGGLVVDFLPVRSVDPLEHARDVPTHYSTVLRDAHSVVDALGACGALSAQERDKAIRELGTRGAEPAEAKIDPGTELTCRFDAVELLSLAGVLDVAAATFRIAVQSNEVEREQLHVENAAIGDVDAEWVAAVVSHLRDGLASGRYELLPEMSERESESEGTRDATPLDRVLFDLLRFPATDADVVWIDDRYATAFEHREDGTRVVGTVDLLIYLKEAGRISADECARVFTEMRASDIRFVAFDEEELLTAVRSAPVEKGRLVESKALRVLRQYYAATVVQGNMLRPPLQPDGSPNPKTEWKFLLASGSAVVGAMMRVFEVHDDHAAARADWLMRNMYADDRGVHGASASRSLEDDDYRAVMSLVSLIAGSLRLDTGAAQRRARREYLRWLYHAVMRPRFAADAELANATAERLKRVMTEAISHEDSTTEAVLTRLIGRLWQDLPTEIRRVVDADQAFLGAIGVSLTDVAEFGPVRVVRRVLWDALSQTLEDGEPKVIDAVNKATVEVQRVSIDPAVFHMKAPALEFEGHLAGDEFGFLSGAFAVRERSAVRLGHWFDIPRERREELVARIVGGQDAATRMELATDAREASMEERYRRVFDSIQPGGTFRPVDSVPSTPRHLLDHLRIDETDASDDRWARAATRLVADVGVVGAVLRLGGIPIRLPDVILQALGALPAGERRKAMRMIRKVLLASPVGAIQLGSIWARLAPGNVHAHRVQGRLALTLSDRAQEPVWEAWLATVRWTQEQFGFDAEMRQLPPDIHLMLVWAHSDRLFRVLMAKGLQPDWIRAAFEGKEYGVAPSLVFDRVDFSADVAAPEHLRAETMAMAGLGLLESEDPSFATMLAGVLDRWIGATASEGRERWVYPLFADRRQATNLMGTWLSLRPEGILPEDLRSLLAPTTLDDVVDQACSAILQGNDERLNWLKLLAAYGEFPPAPVQRQAIERAVTEVDLGNYLVTDPWCAVAAVRLIGQHARHWNEGVRAAMRAKLFDIAANCDGVEVDAETRRALHHSLLDSLVSCAWWQASGEARAVALAQVLERLAEVAPAVFEGAGVLVVRLCDALPVREARHLWRVRDLLRRAARV